ncbi:MAG: tRNA (adenosine(37)-N6)-threonylcarbamoyltransferase complex dimerization subunit type 1 TsaB [Candidatus Dormibacteria bacterium]
MTVLALDTASREAAWVVTTDTAGTVINERPLAGGHLDTLLPAVLADVLSASIVAVVVLTGPGSYTGVRGGMAAALGVASARGLPLHGIGSLVAVAAAAAEPDGRQFLVIADAGRGGVYCASFKKHDGRPVQVTAVQRRAIGELGPSTAVYATTGLPLPGLSRVNAVAALAAAVPLALAAAPLVAAGLEATHAEGASMGAPRAVNP